MGCGSSKNAVDAKNKTGAEDITPNVDITKFGEGEEEDIVDDEKKEDFFEKIKNVDLPQNAEESQIQIRQKRKNRELRQGGFL